MPEFLKNENTSIWVYKILIPVLMTIMTAVVSVGGFIALQIWERVENGIIQLDQRMDKVELVNAQSSSVIFTSKDWMDAKHRMDDDRALLDRRTTRLEEAIPQIRESLQRIEKNITR